MKSVDLTTRFQGFNLQTPLIAASGPATKDYSSIRRLVQMGIGAVITKTILLEPSTNPRPCLYRGAGYLLNTERCSTLPLSTWLSKELPRLAELPIPVIASIGMTSSEAAELAKPIVDAGADMLELSIFTPYDDPSPMIEAIRRVKSRVSVPVLVKLSSNVHDLVEFGQALRDSGANGFSAIDAVKAGLTVDINTGRPALLEQGFGRISGESIKPLALYHVAQLSHYVGLPVIGTGGVMSGRDVLEMIYCGAQAVGLCTVLVVNEPEVIKKITSQLKDTLTQLGYSSIEEAREKTLSMIDFPQDAEERREYEKRLWRVGERVAAIDQERCTNCGICQRACLYHAVQHSENEFWISPSECQGCGLCVSMCPTEAISLHSAEEEGL